MDTYITDYEHDFVEVEEEGQDVDPLESELFSFANDELRELAMILRESRVTGLEVAVEDVSVKLTKKRKVAVAKATAETQAVKSAKPLTSKYLGVLSLFDAKGNSYTKVGEEVKKGQVLATVENMGLANQIKADRSGKMAEILEDNGKPVQYGQVLFLIED